MQQHVLVPLDGSAMAEAIIPQVIPLARAYGSAVTLLKVIAPPLIMGPLGGPVAIPEELPEELEREAHDYLARVARRLAAQGVPVRIKVLYGNPALSITGYVEKVPGVRLLAMAAHSHGDMHHLIFNDVVAQVGSMIPIPVLLFFPRKGATITPRPVTYRKILVPLDRSASSELALSEAAQIASSVGATIVLASVAPASARDDIRPAEEPARVGGGPTRVATPSRSSIERCTAYLEAKASELRAQGIAVQTEAASGQPVEELLRIIGQQQPDLLVMAAHRRSEVQRLFRGSVAAKVMRGTGLPGLLVQAREDG